MKRGVDLIWFARILWRVITTLEAIYEAGQLRLLQHLALPQHTRVRVRVETAGDDEERGEWLAVGEQSLLKVWDNDADDVYNELLAT